MECGSRGSVPKTRRGSTLGHFGYDSVGSLGKILTSFVARWFLMFFSIVSIWLLQFVPSKVSTFSRIMHKIHLNCPHVIPNPFLILSIFFPHSPKNPQTLHLAQGRWRDAPRSAAARAETFQTIGTGTGGTTFGAGGTEGWAEWEDGDEIMGKMEGVIKQRTKMGISCRLYPILPNVKFPPWTPWF